MTVFTDMNDALFTNDDIAADAVYKAGGTGPDTDVRVVLDKDVEILGAGNSEVAQKTNVIDVRISDVASPDIGDTFTVDGTTYTVDNLIDADESVSKLSART